MKARGLRGRRNQCAACLTLFNSNGAFDAHRVGEFEVKEGPTRRRCLTTEEMIDKGMSINAAGFWVTKKNDRFDEDEDDESLEEVEEGEGS